MKREEKQQEIVKMFDDIANSYDFANRLLSCGIDISWRKRACELAFSHLKKECVQIVDVACGTGDMITHWERNAKNLGIRIGKITGVDPSQGMLKVACQKLAHVQFIEAEAKSLPINDESVDIVSIAYGLRNVVDREEALKEFYRILRKGGVLVILEFTKNEGNSLGERIMSFYTKRILPYIGGIVSRNYAAYKYLPDSIEEFLTKTMLNAELAKVGLEPVFSKSYSANISSLFIARKS